MRSIEDYSTPDSEPQATGISWTDIVRMLFKHKGKLLLFTVLGLAGAVALYFTHTPVYESTSKIFVRYVEEISNVDTTSESPRRAAPTVESVISAELEILQSWDLAYEVVDRVTPGAILGNSPEISRALAAKVFLKGLEVTAPKGGRVITATYRHTNPEVAASALTALVKLYRKKHVDIHRATTSRETARSRRAALTAKVGDLTEQIERIKAENGISSLPDAAKGLNARVDEARIETERAQVDLKEQTARIAEMKRLGLVNESVSGSGSKETVPSAPSGSTPHHAHFKYQNILKQLTRLQDEELKLLGSYSRESEPVKAIRKQIDEQEAQRQSLEKEHPALLSVSPQISAGNPLPPAIDPMVETVRLATLAARLEMLEKRQEAMKGEVRQFSIVSRRLHDLERERDLQSEGLKQFASGFLQNDFETPLTPEEYDNIVVVQESSPPVIAISKLVKLVIGVAGGGFVLGFLLVALIELVINRSVQRPVELESRTGVPLLVNIPKITARQRLKQLANGKRPGAKELATTGIEAWSGGHFIRPYAEAIRDRLVLHFEQIGLTRKPKLVAVASHSKGAGVSTIASGVAAALSEVGDGKVLLVDMNVAHAEVHPFFGGKPAASLNDALEFGDKIESVSDNLYLATAANGSGNHGAQMFPKRFYDLMPDFQASDFDYIIFDMPPLDESSLTLAMSGFMDKLLLVVEAEKDNRDMVKRASAELVRARAKLSGILNKTRFYGPKWLQEA